MNTTYPESHNRHRTLKVLEILQTCFEIFYFPPLAVRPPATHFKLTRLYTMIGYWRATNFSCVAQICHKNILNSNSNFYHFSFMILEAHSYAKKRLQSLTQSALPAREQNLSSGEEFKTVVGLFAIASATSQRWFRTAVRAKTMLCRACHQEHDSIARCRPLPGAAKGIPFCVRRPNRTYQ